MEQLIELGRSTTHGQTLPLGTDDPVVAARAVRRALATAGRRAMDVTAIVVAATDHIPTDVLARFARRALGPHGASVRSIGVAGEHSDAETLADHAASAARELAGDGDGVVGVIVALGLAPDGTTEARCLGRATGAPARPEG